MFEDEVLSEDVNENNGFTVGGYWENYAAATNPGSGDNN